MPIQVKAPISRSFESVEDLEEVAQSLGWLTEYRQLQPGAFSSIVRKLDGDSWFLMSEQSHCMVEVEGGAPAGMYMLALVQGAPGVVNGQTLLSNHIYLQCPGSEFRTILPKGMEVTQVGIVAELFAKVVAAVAPELAVPREGSVLIETAPRGLLNLWRIMDELLSHPPSRPASQQQTISEILAGLVTIAADHSSAPVTRNLYSAPGRRALARAREYIEARLRETIRVTSVCNYAGTTLRSLERIFARELGVSPQQYVKIRRLNAVHHCLWERDTKHNTRIADVAHAHGFAHLGRFAGDYRRHFGESPRETRRRRP